jgi:hypothetical protein
VGGTLASGVGPVRPRRSRLRWWLLVGAATLLISLPGGAGARRLLAGTDEDDALASGGAPTDPTAPTTTPAPPSSPAPTTAPAPAPAPPPAPAFPATRQASLSLRPALRGRTVFVAGDSLTVQAMAPGPGRTAPRDLEVHAGLGWTAASVQPELDESVAATPIGTLIVALGTNDSSLLVGTDGWTPDDVTQFRRLMSTPEASACVVLVLPGHGAAIDPAYATEMDEARAALRALAWERGTTGAGPTVLVDWQTVIDRQPTLLAGDGIHLADDPATHAASAASSAARTDLYWQGVRQCGGA